MTAAAIADPSATMVGEAHHRFFNSLQLIVSATNGILRAGECDPRTRERLLALQERVSLLAEINRRLSGPFGPESVAPGALRRLCAALADAFERTNMAISIRVTGGELPHGRRRTLVLLIGELVTNAIKHGRSDRQLLLDIDLVVAADCCRLVVRNNVSSRCDVVNPRVAADLVELAGGTLKTRAEAGEFRVHVEFPSA